MAQRRNVTQRGPGHPGGGRGQALQAADPSGLPVSRELAAPSQPCQGPAPSRLLPTATRALCHLRPEEGACGGGRDPVRTAEVAMAGSHVSRMKRTIRHMRNKKGNR